MCGVLLLMSQNRTEEDAQNIAEKMLVPLRESRGPDSGHVKKIPSTNLIFGHARLSIVDLDSRSDQPMVDGGSGLSLTFNGMIYNYRELKSELSSQYSFRTESDTEVLLAGLCVWGLEKTLEKLKGMFAFCAFDPKSRQIWLARDRAGEKPLVYGRIGDDLVVSSDLRVLREHPAWEGEVSPSKILSFLQYRFLPAPDSFFEGFHKLKPAHFMKIKLDQPFQWEQKSFWSVEEEYENTETDSFNDPVATLKEGLIPIFNRFVETADVPMGSFLSGGTDSTLVTAMARLASDRPLQAFTIQFEEKGFDESAQAAQVAKALNLKHWIVPFGIGEFKQSFEDNLKYLDEPFAVHSYFPLSYLAKFAKQHVTVCLSGDGGDELYGGYNRHVFWHNSIRKLMKMPQIARSSMAHMLEQSLAKGLFLKMSDQMGIRQPQDKYEKVKKVLQVDSLEDFYQRLLVDKDIIQSEPISPIDFSKLGLMTTRSSTEKMMAQDFSYYLPNDVLNKVDRATMAYGLEARAPLLDIDSIQLALKVPMDLKIKGKGGKYLLKQLLKDLLPSVDHELPKSGFTTPIGQWMNQLMGADFVDEYQSSGLDSLFSQSYNEKLMSKDHSHERDFIVYMLVKWMNRHDLKMGALK